MAHWDRFLVVFESTARQGWENGYDLVLATDATIGNLLEARMAARWIESRRD